MKLDDQLCFALYAATNAIIRNYRPLLSEIGLTYPQYLVMIVLWQGGPQSIKSIADRLQLGPNAITPLVDRLEKAGLVERRPGKDRRSIQVTPTATGLALEATAAVAHETVACRTKLPKAEFDGLKSDLHALAQRLLKELDPTAVDNFAT